MTFEGDIAEIKAKLGDIDKLLRGNGTPGVMVRLDRVERAVATSSKLTWIIVTSVVSIAAATLWRSLGG